MTDAFTLWSLFKDSTTLQAVLGSLIGFLVMHLFQQRRTAVPNMPMDERLMPGYRGGLSAATMPSDLPFSMGSKSQKTKNSKQPEKQKQKSQQADQKATQKRTAELERKLFEMLVEEDDSEDSDEQRGEGRMPARKQQQQQQKQKSKPAATLKQAPQSELRRRRGRPPVVDESVDPEEDDDEDEEEAGESEDKTDKDSSEQSAGEEAELSLVPYSNVAYSEAEMLKRATDFANLLSRRRSCRQFSERPVDPEVVRLLVTAAGSSPSGAHTEPWTYVCVTNELMKRRIREIVEEEEEINYARRMSAEWKADLAKLRTSWEKPYLTEAPVIVVLMRQVHGWRSGREEKRQHYYSEISVSISAGLFLAAVQNVGLCTLTSTPMNAGPALRRLLGRPPNEKVHLLLPLGYAAHNAQVPNLTRKPVEKIMVNI
ncbi:hypothetical protein BOX15_Mlig026904g2 [Macrostomum lignano]|uniref:Nitroreductase domain-containing protein n=2 Tax=Macrostomum lignano TaxID=282301 RepID=A0A267DN25_9PLAT|nr:hypothetical protein BOX15_Mlig026904g2 [Macrostomum lignano]